MSMGSPRFDLVLSYPQWQGSGRPEHLKRGGQATADVCKAYGPLVVVDDAGPGVAIDGVNHWPAIFDQFKSAQTLLAERTPSRVLTAGGDCACDVAVIDYLLRMYPDLVVVWVDAHLDANTVQTSPSGNFHGMPVAAILGGAPDALKGHLGAPLTPSQFRYASAHVGDEGDWLYQKANGLVWLEDDETLTGPVHIHFDLDVLDPERFPFQAYADGTLSLESGLALVRRIASTADLVGLTITEFAPANAKDAATGGEYINRLCRAALCLD